MTEIPGTTRDLISVNMVINGRSIQLIDTAGIRKSKSVKGFIESQSVFRSLRAISESDVVVFMIDANYNYPVYTAIN